MPIYEYVCDACGNGFERIQSFGDAPLDTCPECSGSVRRIISPVGVIFKGSGWYITDSKRQLTGTSSAKPAAGNGAKEATEPAGEPAKTPKAPKEAATAAPSDSKPATGGTE
jgi:putative FmdB family regulatory protein